MVEAFVGGLEGRAVLLSAVADPVRLGLLDRLAEWGTSCVCDLRGDPPIPGNLLSYHLRVLREAGLVTAVKRGRWVDYTLAGDALARLHGALPALDRSGSLWGPVGLGVGGRR